MTRTTFTIDDEVRRRLRRIAAQQGVSIAALIREAIDEKVGRLAAKPQSLGVGASGVSDTARISGEERPEPRTWR